MRTAIASAALAAGLLASLAPAPLPPTEVPPSGDTRSSPVRIALDSRPAREGGTTYAITVRNTSGSDAPHGLVTHLLPDALGYVSARPRARTTGRQVTWRIALPAGSSRVLTVTAAPGRTEDDGAHDSPAPRPYDAPAAADAAGLAGPVSAAARRADARGDGPVSATTVCFQGGAGGRWLTCTSAGDDWPPKSWVSSNKVYAVGSAAAALVVGTAGIVVLRRRRARDTDDDRPGAPRP